MNMRMIFVMLLLGIGTSGCISSRTEATATEKALCESWGESLPTRSVDDTRQTRDEITVAYADFAAACPAWVHLIPEGV
jgi:uncharacterized protein YceK